MILNKEQKETINKLELALYESNAQDLVKYLKQAKQQKIPKDNNLAATLFPALLKVVMNGWEYGWNVMYQNFPSVILTSDDDGGFPILWEIAAVEGHLHILKDIEKLGANILKHKDSKKRNTAHLMFDSIGFHRLFPTENNKIIETIKWFKENNIDIHEPHPGFFGENDTLKAGHSLWEYAIKYYNWHLVLAILPETWEDVLKSKRWKMQVAELHSFVKKHSNMETDLLWLLWLDRFFDHWYYDSSQFSTFHEIKLLTGVFSRPEKDMSKFWEIINTKNENDRTWWHVIVQHIDDDTFDKILNLAEKEDFNIAEKLLEKDNIGIRPIDNLLLQYEIKGISPFEGKYKELFLTVKNSMTKEDADYTNIFITEPLTERLK